MFKFLLILQTLIAASLVSVILMQRSEGGGLGVGGSSSGFMTARGAADFLTRATSILGAAFIVLSIALAGYASATREPAKVDTSLAGKLKPTDTAPAPGAPGSPATQPPAGGPTPLSPRPAAPTAPSVPLAQ